MSADLTRWQEVMKTLMTFKRQPNPETRIKVLDQLFLYEQESLTDILCEEQGGVPVTKPKQVASQVDDTEHFSDWLDSFDEGAQQNILNVMEG
jgi:hypothetical protein